MLDSNPRGPEGAKIALSNKSEALPGRRENPISYGNAHRACCSGKASHFITGALIEKGIHQQLQVSARGLVVHLVLLYKLAKSKWQSMNSMLIYEMHTFSVLMLEYVCHAVQKGNVSRGHSNVQSLATECLAAMLKNMLIKEFCLLCLQPWL